MYPRPPPTRLRDDLCGPSAPTLQRPPQCLHRPISLQSWRCWLLTEFFQDPSLVSASHPCLANKNKVSAGLQALWRRGRCDPAPSGMSFPRS